MAPNRSPRLRQIEQESLRRARDVEQIREALSARNANPELFRRFYSSRASHLTPRAALSPTIKIQSPFVGEKGTEITGILRASSSRVAFYVDSRVNGSVVSSDLEEIRQGFDEISLPRLHTLFGKESDIDGNDVINVFLADPAKIGTDVIGFFQPSDLLPNGAIGGVTSNQMEIVYVRTPGASFDFALAQATIAHEVFHLINFSVKSLPLFQRTGGFAGVMEELFLNEGQAHLAEDLTGWGIGTPEIVKIYLDCINKTSLGGGGAAQDTSPCRIAAAGNDSLARRGGTMLFLLYMFQQLGGAEYSTKTAGAITGDGIAFLHHLTESDATGISNLESSSGDRSFFSWYGDFAGALVLDNTGSLDDTRYEFSPDVMDSFTGFLRNIRTHSVRSDDLGPIKLTGPNLLREITAEQNLTVDATLLVTGANAIRLTVPANLRTSLRIEGSGSLALGMAIVPVP